MKETRISFDGINYTFGADGFLASATLDGFLTGEQLPACGNNFGRLHIQLSSGENLIPYSAGEPVVTHNDDNVVVEFNNILFKGESGSWDGEFRLTLRYDLLTRGRAFVSAFFCAKDMTPPDFDEFSVQFDVPCGSYGKDTRWGFIPRPRKIDAAAIQAIRLSRNLSSSKNESADNEIIPDVSLNVRAENGETAFFEIIMTGENSVSEKLNDYATDIRWQDNGNCLIKYDFITNKPCKCNPMQLRQWRNQWGWVLKTADKVRHKPPFRMYHYFDNYIRYPSDECIKSLAANQTDVLILHENWRYDLQNDGVPFNADELRRVIKTAHEYNIRIALYIRGNELSAMQGACPWFDRYLKKDFDGFYMDYGGPTGVSYTDETYPGGKVAFTEYVERMHNLRKRIGEDGVFYGHTGTSYSAIWYASGMIDGYVSGEGENGVMASTRENHEFFSEATASTGTMWVAAFPEYTTGKMRPFLASTGQYPHCTLGEQFKTASLSHPREPGINDVAFRPLWKIWHIMYQERNIGIINDYNSAEVFEKDRQTGHYLMISADKSRAVLLVSNFAAEKRTVTATLNRDLCGFIPDKMKAVLLMPSETNPGKAIPVSADKLAYTIELGKWDVAAIYFDSNDARMQAALADFETPYPGYSESNLRYLENLENQRKLRENPTPSKELYVSLTVPNLMLPYEYSLLYDLYYNAMALVEFLPDGTKKRLGWISQKGFVAAEPPPEDYIWPDVVSPRVALHEILGKGKHYIGIESVHYGGPFYSFLYADIFTSAEGKDGYRIEFVNELEPQREFLRWHVEII